MYLNHRSFDILSRMPEPQQTPAAASEPKVPAIPALPVSPLLGLEPCKVDGWTAHIIQLTVPNTAPVELHLVIPGPSSAPIALVRVVSEHTVAPIPPIVRSFQTSSLNNQQINKIIEEFSRNGLAGVLSLSLTVRNFAWTREECPQALHEIAFFTEPLSLQGLAIPAALLPTVPPELPPGISRQPDISIATTPSYTGTTTIDPTTIQQAKAGNLRAQRALMETLAAAPSEFKVTLFPLLDTSLCHRARDIFSGQTWIYIDHPIHLFPDRPAAALTRMALTFSGAAVTRIQATSDTAPVKSVEFWRDLSTNDITVIIELQGFADERWWIKGTSIHQDGRSTEIALPAILMRDIAALSHNPLTPIFSLVGNFDVSVIHQGGKNAPGLLNEAIVSPATPLGLARALSIQMQAARLYQTMELADRPELPRIEYQDENYFLRWSVGGTDTSREVVVRIGDLGHIAWVGLVRRNDKVTTAKLLSRQSPGVGVAVKEFDEDLLTLRLNRLLAATASGTRIGGLLPLAFSPLWLEMKAIMLKPVGGKESKILATIRAQIVE